MTIDSTIDFEKRRNVPVRYDRELIQTTVKAIKRVGEIKARRERAFFKHRMAASREKQRAHRKKTLEAIKSSVKLHEPISIESLVTPEKIKVPVKVVKTKSALIQGQGRSMDMEID